MSWLSSLLSGGGGSRIDGKQARELVANGAFLLDVRSPAEFGGRHVDGATNIPVDQLSGRLSEIPKGKGVVVYCASGGRSARAAGVLANAGFEVHDLGGMFNW